MKHEILAVVLISAVTILIRFLPFIIFRDSTQVPESITYLGKALPGAVMGMLVIYCLKDVSFLAPPYGIPELICAALTAGAYLWKKDTSFSVVIGTVLYMILIQKVF